MAKVLFITDQHFGVRNDSRNFSRYFARFYTEVLLPYIDKHKITRVFDLGDTFDRRKYINFQTLKDAKDMWFDPIRERGIHMDLIVGNHCTSYKNTNEVNSPDLLLREYDNITVYDSATDIEIEGTKLAILPWVCSDNYLESMEFLQKTRSQILLGHLEIKGFEMHLGAVSDTGFDETLFKKFDRVFSGHFHHKSQRGNIDYLGAPYEMTWSDYGDDRGFHVFDTDTREIEFIRNPLSIFYKLFYDDSTREVAEEQIESFDSDKYYNTFVKIVIKERNDPFLFDRFIEKVENAQPIDLTFIDNTIDLMFQDEIDDEDIEDTASIIASMVDSVPKETIREPLKNLMLELHRTAVSQSSMG